MTRAHVRVKASGIKDWYLHTSRHYVAIFLIKHIKTLNVRGASYLGLTRSISCLLIPWLVTSPGHQQP